jgi:DNA-binding beta-propeller fold protein YncE
MVTVGQGAYRYRPVEKWEKLPAGWSFGEVAGVATDSRDRVYVLARSEHPIMVFDRDGNFLTSWGEGDFQRPHGIFIGPDDAVYCTDDVDHAVRKFTPDGKLLLTLGTRGKPCDTGIDGMDYRTIKRVGPPFNRPTNLALSRNGDMYVTDGYGNARVHKFAPDGRLLFSWGEPGSGPGQFNLPHGVAVDRDERIFVADRENSRIQIFDFRGKFLEEWTDVVRPMEVFIDRSDNILVAEVGFRAGLFPWATPPADPPGARVSVFTPAGKLLCRWGGGAEPWAAGDFFAPHDLWVDSRGDLYVGEVTLSAGGNRGLVRADCHCFQKFVRV